MSLLPQTNLLYAVCLLLFYSIYFKFLFRHRSSGVGKSRLGPFNIFYNLPSLAPPKASDLRDELDRYLSTDPEDVDNILAWWYEQHGAYPQLSHMVFYHLTIPDMFK